MHTCCTGSAQHTSDCRTVSPHKQSTAELHSRWCGHSIPTPRSNHCTRSTWSPAALCPWGAQLPHGLLETHSNGKSYPRTARMIKMCFHLSGPLRHRGHVFNISGARVCLTSRQRRALYEQSCFISTVIGKQDKRGACALLRVQTHSSWPHNASRQGPPAQAALCSLQGSQRASPCPGLFTDRVGGSGTCYCFYILMSGCTERSL